MADADVCVKLRPDWEKSYFRRGMALEANGDDNDAIAAFECCAQDGHGRQQPRDRPPRQAPQTKVRPSNIHVPKAKVPTKSTSPATGTGPKGDPKWLLTAKSPGEPVPARIAAVNEVGTWLAQHLERSLKKTPGESEWFFEDKEVVSFLDAGVFGSCWTSSRTPWYPSSRGAEGNRGGGGFSLGGRRPRGSRGGVSFTTSSTPRSGRGATRTRPRRCS